MERASSPLCIHSAQCARLTQRFVDCLAAIIEPSLQQVLAIFLVSVTELSVSEIRVSVRGRFSLVESHRYHHVSGLCKAALA